MKKKSKGSRFITQSIFDDIKFRALIMEGNSFVYDEIFDDVVKKVVAGTLYRFLKVYPSAREDILQELRLHIWLGANKYLRSPECNSKECFEGWIVTLTKNLIRKFKRKNKDVSWLEFDEKILVSQVEEIYSVSNESLLRGAIEFILNVDTDPTKNIGYILSKFLISSNFFQAEEIPVEYIGNVQKTAYLFANKFLSPISIEQDFEYILNFSINSNPSAFSSVVKGLDYIFNDFGYLAISKNNYYKILKKYHQMKHGVPYGSLKLLESAFISKDRDFNELNVENNGNYALNPEIISLISDFISKGNNRIQKPISEHGNSLRQRGML